MPGAEQTFQLPWYGIHHIALATTDLDATIHFYKDVLGMYVSAIAPSKEGRGRHCLIFVKPDDDNVWGFHFFEHSTAGRTLPSVSDNNPSSLLPHVALRLSHAMAAQDLRERLNKAHVPIIDIPELGSFVFFDNNHLCLEITWPKD